MQLHYRTYGSGFPLIILHGLLGSLNNWHTLAGRFGEHFQVYVLDQRNHGGSPHSDLFTYEAMAGDVVEFMTAHGLERAHILGHSMGGKTAMHLALNRPGLLAKLVVVDIAPRAYEGSHDELMDAMEMVDLASYSSREEIDGLLSFQISNKAVRQFLLTNLKRGEGGVFRWKVNLRALQSNLRQILESRSTGKPFNGETLFLTGGDSAYVTEQDRLEIAALFPRVSFHAIPGAGHWVHADAPDEFFKTVNHFLA